MILSVEAKHDFRARRVIAQHVLGRGVRPIRHVRGDKVQYLFHRRYLDVLLLAFPEAEISPAVDNLILKREQRRLKDIDAPKLDIPDLYTELWSFQAQGVAEILKQFNKGFMLHFDMGLGKTLCALAALLLTDAFPALVVCPNSAKWTTWQRIANDFTDIDVQVVDGTPAQRINQIKRRAELTVVNIEMIRVKIHGRGPNVRYVPTNPDLFDFKYEALIVDEYHNLKSPTAQQTNGYLRLKHRRFLPMSGTPILNHPLEIWPTVHKIDPKQYPSYWAFEKSLIIKDGSLTAYHPKRMAELKEFVDKRSLRIRKDQVRNDLPEKVYQTRLVTLTREQRRLYERIKQEFILELQDTSTQRVKSPLSQITRLKQACFSPELYGGSKKSAKINELKDIVYELVEAEHKALIFSQWSKATRIIQRELAEYNPAYVDGSVKGSKRMAEVDKFQEDPNCHLYIGTIRANKESITLGKATYVIFTDKGWTPAENEQAIARSAAGGLRGAGVKGVVNVIELFAEDTIEARIEDLLNEKADLFRRFIERDGGAKVRKRVMGSIRELFEEELAA